MVSINEKWQEGAIPGKMLKKPSRTPEEVSQAKNQYEQKRSRSYKLHTTGCRNENYHINDSKFSSSHSEKVFSYTWLLSNLLDQSGHQKHHTTRPIEILLDTGCLLNV
jgi:hypothetical protein